MREIVIVGAGLTGYRAALGLREAGYSGRLTMIGDEVHRPYDRPPLSKQVLAGSMAVDALFFPVDGLGLDWRLGVSATALDPVRQVVGLADGSEVGYDGLVVATGRRARTWTAPVPAGVHVLRTLDDAVAFRAALRPDARAVIIGGGFIGCEAAATLRARGAEVTVVDIAPAPMPVLGAEVGERARALHERNGVRFRFGVPVDAIEGAGAVDSVRLVDGTVLAADLVLVAMGSAPNSEWLAGSGLRLVNGSVVCDRGCFALDEDGNRVRTIVAAGDIAARPHPHADTEVCIEHWTNARDMGAAARNLLAGPSPGDFVSVPTFWSDQYTVKIKSAGYLRAATDFVVVDEDEAKPALVVEARRDGELVGAITFNRNRTLIDYQRKLAADLAAAAT